MRRKRVMKTEKNKMIDGKWDYPSDKELVADREKIRKFV